MKRAKRKVLAALLATCLLAALLPAGALAAGEGHDYNHPICGAECDHDADHTGVSWTAWNPTDPNQKPTTAGYYYFTDDLIASPDGDTEGISWLVPDGASYLCLNGHSVAQLRKSITISTGSTLTICDCQGGGSVGGWNTGTDHGTIEVINGGTLNLYSGTIHANGESQGSRCAIYVAGASSHLSKVNLYGGTVQAQNPATNAGTGYAVYLAKLAEVYIYGGSFSASDKGHYSCALFSDSAYCTATVTGGSFTGDGPAAMVGGYNGGTLNISGGTFTSTHDSALNIQTKGTGNISGGVFIGAPEKDAVYVAGRSSTPPAKATLSGGIYSTQPIADEEEHLVFAEGKSAQIITANDEGYQAAYAGYYIVKEKAPAHSHPICGVLCSSATRPTEEAHGDTVTFLPITIDTDGKLLINGMAATASYDSYELPQGSYYLDGDVTLDKPLGIASSATVNLCLNGYKLSMKNGVQNSVILLKSSRTLNLCDCYLEGTTHAGQDYYHTYTSPVSNAQKTVQGGLITGGNSTSDGGGAIYLNGAGTLNTYGGTIAGNRSADNGGGVCVAYNGAFNMYGGSIRDNACDGKGGGVYVANGGGTFTLSGRATIGESDGVGNSAAEGGGVYIASSGTFNMNGGSVCNNTATTNGGGVYYANGNFNVSGEVIVNSNTVNSKDNNIYLASGRTISTDSLSQWSWLYVTSQTVPTESDPVNITSTLNADHSSAFYSDDSRYVIQDNDLGNGYHQVRLVKAAHTHTWAPAWSNNDTHHWHACTADGCPVTADADKDGYGAHIYTDDQDATCNTCAYTRTIQPSGATLAQWLAENELTVKDVFVTAANAGNILSGDPANDGKVKLELVNGRATLTLDNANIVYEDSWPKIIDLTVYSDNDQYLDIKVVGTVNLVSKPTESWGQGDGISGGSMGGTGGKAHFRIEGGTLNIKNDSSRPGTGFYTSGTLTVAGADTVVNIDSGTDEEWSRPILGKVEDLLKLEDGLAVTDPANGEMVYNYSTKDWYLSDGNRGTAHKLTVQKPGAQPGHTPTYNVSGTVTDGEDAAVSGATVKLMQGNTQFGETATTDTQGLFSFDGVKPGVYNIVATKDGVTMTKLVTVTNADLTNQTLTMPDGNVSSVLDVKPNTPDVVVGGLEQEAADNAAGAGAVTVTMTVETKEETDADTAPDIAKIKETASGKTLAFLAITVEKQVDDAEAEAIEETTNLLTIVIPFDRTGKKDVTVYRCHGDVAEALTTNPNADGEYFTVSDAAVTVYAKKFSTYAIGYTEVAEPPTPPTPSRPSSSSTTRYTVTATATGGGKLDPSGAVRVSRNSNKTFTITPNEGYEIADVLVDGESVGAVTKYTFEKITKDHTIEASFQKAEVRSAWNPFVDVKSGDWFHDSVKAVYENGLMVGMDSTHFAPTLDTSRAMITTVLWRLAGSPDPRETVDYTDCDGEAYYAKAVAWATENGIVEGYGDGKFGPDDPITREQLAAMLYRYAGSPAAHSTLDGFTDSGIAGSWAIGALRWAVEQGILQGKDGNVLDPTGRATRAEAAAMLMRYCQSEK